MKALKTGLFALLLTAALPLIHGQGPRQAARPYPDASTPKPVDVGSLRELSGTTPISLTISLGLRDAEAAERLMTAI